MSALGCNRGMFRDSSIILKVLFICLVSITTTCNFSYAFPTNDGKKLMGRPFIPDNSFSHQSASGEGVEILLDPLGKGMGAFASVFISKGEWIGEYSGELLTRKEVEARYWNLRNENKHDRKWRNSRKRRNQGISGDYLFDMGSDTFIDGEDADVSSWCRFANHATPDDGAAQQLCNTEARTRRRSELSTSNSIDTNSSTDKKKNDKTIPKLFFRAMIDIEAGQEICYDYGEEYWAIAFPN